MLNETVRKYRMSEDLLEQQVNDIMGDIDLDEVLLGKEKEYQTRVEVNDIVNGRVINLRNDTVLVDFGYKSEGILPYTEDHEFRNDDLDLGDEVQFLVSKVHRDGTVFLSRKYVEDYIQQQKVLSQIETGTTVNGKLQQITKAGWIVDLNGLQALLPHQQAHLTPGKTTEELVGEVFPMEIETIDEGFVVCTRKDYEVVVKKRAKDEFMSNLEVGKIVSGTVKNITDFGVFIQVASGIIGLCHSSDVGEAELKTGQSVQSRVLKIDRAKNRVSLGIRQVTEPTWEEIIAKYGPDDVVEVTVKSLVPYGAFVDIEPGVSGLIHVSDLSWSDHVKHPKEILEEGQTTQAMILSIDVEKQHLSLGVKQLTADPWETVAERYLAGASVPGRVTNKTKFGIFVSLEPGVEGLAHHTIETQDIRPGDDILVSIMRVDAVRKKIALAVD